jgi:3-methyladenine DNA glycosylase AlkD
VKAADLSRELKALGDPKRAAAVARFFKTGPGQYGEGDIFVGVPVPQQRRLAAAYKDMPLPEILKLLRSRIHEERLCALFLMAGRFQRDEAARPALVKAYLKNLKWVNNWDLVDSSAPQILGEWLHDKPRALLQRMARSRSLWERRVAMLSCYAFIRRGEQQDAFRMAEALLGDGHDLMHKAVGWMLREVGKRVGVEKLRGFLKKNAARMPRTALRYSIELFDKAERGRWLRAGR